MIYYIKQTNFQNTTFCYDCIDVVLMTLDPQKDNKVPSDKVATKLLVVVHGMVYNKYFLFRLFPESNHYATKTLILSSC